MRHAAASLLLLVVACQREPARDTTAVRRPAKSTTTPASKDITIDLLATANPVVVIGHAREAALIRAFAADRSLLAEQKVDGDPYRADLWITRNPGDSITIEATSGGSSASKTARWEIPATSVTLVFPTKDCTEFDVFRREVPKGPAIARVTVEALLAGPTAEEKARGASAPFPSGSACRSVILRNGVLTVDFNERLQNAGGSCAATAIRESVTKTLMKLPTVKKVVITAGGNEKLALQP